MKSILKQSSITTSVEKRRFSKKGKDEKKVRPISTDPKDVIPDHLISTKEVVIGKDWQKNNASLEKELLNVLPEPE